MSIKEINKTLKAYKKDLKKLFKGFDCRLYGLFPTEETPSRKTADFIKSYISVSFTFTSQFLFSTEILRKFGRITSRPTSGMWLSTSTGWGKPPGTFSCLRPILKARELLPWKMKRPTQEQTGPPRCRGLLRGIASPAILCRKEPARASKAPY